MISSNHHFPSNFDTSNPHHHTTPLTPPPVFTTTTPLPHDHPSQTYQQALALLRQSASYPADHHPLPLSPPAAQPAHHSGQTTSTGWRHDSAAFDATVDWQHQGMYAATYHNSVGGGHSLHRRSGSHHRTPSASTVASTGPASPYPQSHSSYPLVANTDRLPDSPANFADQALYAKALATPSQTPAVSEFGSGGYAPTAAAHMSSAHLAMKNFAFDYHTSEDFSDFPPSRQSMSSYGNDSPATPQSGNADVDTKTYNLTQQNEYKTPNPQVQLFRTESAAYQDELYNPNQVYASSVPATKQTTYLSPHRNLITERLQTANLARSTSPGSQLSRDRSPFRDGSPLAPTKDWKPHVQDGRVGTAASMRQQQHDAAAEAEFARKRAPLHREPTKTISPKDALLDYNDNDQQPLFQDSIPDGYRQHLSGTEQWPTNTYMGAPSVPFAGLPANGQQHVSFRNATSAETDLSGTGFDFTALPPSNDPMTTNPYQANYQAAIAAQMHNHTEATPDFPAGLPSMETSISDAGFPQSSQESVVNGAAATSAPQKPSDTRANTGAYTCTYHGCVQRFSSPTDLQKHKREYHRSQQKARESTSPITTADDSSSSPRSTASPAPSNSGMTSAAILARNSQAGPHKCTRINPSTGKPCNTIFSRPYDLTRHEDTIHNNRKQKVRCPMCREEKTFSRNDALTRHMRVVHPEVETMGKRARRSD